MGSMDKTALTKSISHLPQKPGVYFFKDKRNIMLYIGKASRLKNRVSSYLKTTDIRLKKMLDEARTLKYKTADSEIEALILESQFIKKLKPKYNIVMRDDKQYFFVGFSSDRFPKIFLTHRSDTAEFVGPFTDGTALKTTLKFLRKIFPYCTCKQKHNLPCLNYHIGKCPGFCCLKETHNAKLIANNQNFGIYAKNIKAIKELLNGKKTSLIKNLKSEMKKCAEKEQFGKAIELRNKIKKLEKVFQNAKIIQKANSEWLIANSKSNDTKKILEKLTKVLNLPSTPNRIEGYDISNIQGANAVGSMVVFSNGRPDKNEYRKFKIRSKNTPDDTAMLSEMLRRRFRHPEWQFPDLILVDGGKGQLNAVAKTVAYGKSPGAKRKAPIPIIGLAKGKMEIFSTTLTAPISMSRLPIAVQNLIKHIDSEAHRFAVSYHRKLHRKSSLI